MRFKISRKCRIVIELKIDAEAGVDIPPPIIMWYDAGAVQIWKGGEGLMSIQHVEMKERKLCDFL
jgi:hypothetical protein